MKVNKIVRNLMIIILLVSNVGCDQISKGIIREQFDYNDRISVIDNIVTITKVENTGAFLSLGHNLPRLIYKVLMIFLPLVILGYALYYLFKNNLSRLLTLGFCMIIGGGLGNIYDRIIYGSVTDFLYFNFYLFHTGVVNMADISLTTGFCILIYEFLINRGDFKIRTNTIFK